MRSSQKERLKEMQKARKRKIKLMQKTRHKKLKIFHEHVQKRKHGLHDEFATIDYHKRFESAGNNFKKHMHKHTITWIIALVVFLLFVSTAMLFILRAIK